MTPDELRPDQIGIDAKPFDETLGAAGQRPHGPGGRGLSSALSRGSRDVLASLTAAIADIPGAMAASVIVGISPVHGLYAGIVGPIIGGLTAKVPLLVISTTGASALAANEVVKGHAGEERLAALLLLTFYAGVFQAAAAMAGLARLTGFVSHSVMTGFLDGVALLIILGQLGTFFGLESQGADALLKTIDLGRHFSEADLSSALVGSLTVLLLFAGRRLGLGAFGPLIALAVPSLIVSLGGLTSVETVQDVSAIPSTLPRPAIPDFSLTSTSFLTGSLAVAAIVFVQTAGVSQALPGASRAGAEPRDLVASGLANVGSALFQGQPVGGSFGQSAIVLQAGARTRLATILSGVWILVFVLLLGNLIEAVALPCLSALLIVTAWGAIDSQEAAAIWRTGWSSRLTIALPMVLTLLLPIQWAVAAGILLSILFYLTESAADVQIKELVLLPDGQMQEKHPPRGLRAGSVTLLQVYGNLFFAGARTLAKKLPDPTGIERPVVVLRLRGQLRLGATAVDVLSRYSQALQDQGGRLYLAGLDPELKGSLEKGGKLPVVDVQLYPASDVIGKSLAASYRNARAWLKASPRHSK